MSLCHWFKNRWRSCGVFFLIAVPDCSAAAQLIAPISEETPQPEVDPGKPAEGTKPAPGKEQAAFEETDFEMITRPKKIESHP